LGASVDEQPNSVQIDQRDCFGTQDSRPVLDAQAASYVPAGYEVVTTAPPPPPAWLGPVDAKVVQANLEDLVCGSVSVAGHQPQPMIVSIGLVRVTRDGIRTWYVLWMGTDNPLLFAQLRQLGVTSYFIPHSSYSETTNELGQRVITVNTVDDGPGGLNYTRTITVVNEPTIAVSGPGSAYHIGRRGEVAFTWSSSAKSGSAKVCFDLQEGSLPTLYGITNFPSGCFPRDRIFNIGDSALTIELLP
jgi:hypothetical protein